MLYVDPWGEVTGYEDVFSKIDLYRAHYDAVGLGADYVDRFVRVNELFKGVDTACRAVRQRSS